MKLFTVKLTDDERALLERHRQSFGLRSQADAIRHLIGTSPNARADIGAAGAVRVPLGELKRDLLTAEPRTTAKVVSQIETDLNTGHSLPIGPVTPKPGARLKK